MLREIKSETNTVTPHLLWNEKLLPQTKQTIHTAFSMKVKMKKGESLKLLVTFFWFGLF